MFVSETHAALSRDAPGIDERLPGKVLASVQPRIDGEHRLRGARIFCCASDPRFEFPIEQFGPLQTPGGGNGKLATRQNGG